MGTISFINSCLVTSWIDFVWFVRMTNDIPLLRYRKRDWTQYADLESFLMSYVTAGHQIESETGHSILNLESFLMSYVTEGHDIENETGHKYNDLESFIMS